MLVYILKSAACLAILFVFYKLFLEKESIHKFKRFYLLGALVFSLLVPALVFTEYVEVAPPTEVTYAATQPIQLSEDVISVPMALEADVLDIEPVLWGVYFLGLFFFGLKFIRNLFQIFKRIRRNPKFKLNRFTQVLLQEKITPHTFFSYIFLNRTKFESKQIPKEVLLHEETHALQKHSWDVVFVELLQVIFWVNPFIYLAKKAIKLNHEFLADQAVLKNNIDESTYKNTLLSYLSPDSEKKYQSKLANAINYSSIKKRFTIMKRHTSKKAMLIKSLLLLPLLASLLIGFSQKKVLKTVSENFNKMEGTWIEEELELTELSIFTQGETLMIDFEDSQPRQIEKNNGKYYVVSHNGNNKYEVPLLIDEVTGLLHLSKRKYVRKEKSLKKKLLGNWENNNGDVKFEVHTSGRGMVWDIIMSEGYPVRFYPVKKGNSYFFVYDKEPWSFRVENEILLDSKGFQYQRITKTLQSKGTSKVNLAEYNLLAQKYNTIPLEKRIVPLKDLRTMETIYRKMSNRQKQNAQPFPKCLPKNVQDGASRELMKEYGALAKKYNTMLSKSKSIQIKKQDVDRLEYIYGLMSDKQKADAEPFPDFPQPPPPPKAPKPAKAPKVKKGEKSNIPPPPSPNLNDEEFAEKVIDETIANQDPYDHGNQLYSKVFKNEDGTFTAAPIRPSGFNIDDIPPPPAPPEPQSPLDHVIEMAKKGATFYYEGKEVNSDEAIELLKNNESLNIDSRGHKTKHPEVRISKKPYYH